MLPKSPIRLHLRRHLGAGVSTKRAELGATTKRSEVYVHLAVDADAATLWGFLDSNDYQRSLHGIPAYDALDAQVGKPQSLTCPQLSWAWGYNADGSPKYQQLFTPRLQADYDRGRLSVLTWISFNGGDRNSAAQTQLFNNESILAGKHDAYLKQFGQDAAAYGHPFVIRFDPEFNGWWEGPFSEYDNLGKLANGNTDGSFARMWRYVVDAVRGAGATNILWHWCANTLSATTTSPTYVGKLPHFYPGDSYADFIGYDVYNKAIAGAQTWLTFRQCLEGGSGGWPVNSLTPMLALSPGKPWMIGEMGCGAGAKAGDTTVGAGDRPAWIRAAHATIATRYPFIKSIQWFNVDPYTLNSADLSAIGQSVDDFWPGAPLPDPTAAMYRMVSLPDLDAQLEQAAEAVQEATAARDTALAQAAQYQTAIKQYVAALDSLQSL
jgi:Glycosyl hydrolase family 26